MKKILLLVVLVFFAIGTAAAQTYTAGSGVVGVDVLGAHQNGGRGCSACHAPHSGAAGGGGNAAQNATALNDALSGTIVLFGQDVTPLFNYPITFSGGYLENLPAPNAAYTTQRPELLGIMMCLACHDGVVARGQMMYGQSWEQRMNLLPANVYGSRSIPSLLGNDSGNGNISGYANDHPVGVQATLGAVGLVTNNSMASPLLIVFSSSGIASITPNSMAYVQFVANYGYPAIAGNARSFGVAPPLAGTDPTQVYITCTTCHNQHAMYVYTPVPPEGVGYQGAAAKILPGGYYPTYFFVNAPYNPSSGNNSPTLAASTTQFCRQCHFDTANEYYGISTVQTQF